MKCSKLMYFTYFSCIVTKVIQTVGEEKEWQVSKWTEEIIIFQGIGKGQVTILFTNICYPCT